MQVLDHSAIQDSDTASLRCRSFPGLYDLGGVRRIIIRYAEDAVGSVDLPGMDQSLAVEPEFSALFTGSAEPVAVGQISKNTVKYIKTVGPGRQNAGSQRRQQSDAIRI